MSSACARGEGAHVSRVGVGAGYALRDAVSGGAASVCGVVGVAAFAVDDGVDEVVDGHGWLPVLLAGANHIGSL